MAGLRCVALAFLVSACVSPPPPPSPEMLARCTQLFNIWARYEQHWVFHHSGQKARAELALDRCQHGLTNEGIAELTRMLRRGGFTVPD